MSTELVALLQRIQGHRERFAPPTEEPPKPSQELNVLLLRLETRKWQAYAELELIELLRDMEYEIRFIKHALNCKNCLLELCLDVERYLGSHSGLWYLDLQNDPEYFMEIHPDAPDHRKYKFGSYWTRDEGQAIPFIKDRMKWAQNITKKQLPIVDKLLEVVQNWDFSAKAYERYEDLWNQLNIYVSTPPLFWGENLATAQLEKEHEDTMYMCTCCKSLLSTKEYPSVNGMCPECHKSRSENLTNLYNMVERLLSHSLQPGIGYREATDEVMRARNNLRTIMIKMGWQGQF